MAGVSLNTTIQRNPAFFDYAAEDPTAGEIRSAKTQAVCGAPKRCMKGKSCSATCIAAGDDCLVDFPEPVQAEIRKMAQYILNRRTTQGRPVQPGSEEDIQLGKTVGTVGRHLTETTQLAKPATKANPSGIVESRAFGTTASAQKQYVKAKEIAGLKARRDLIGNAQDNENLMKAWQNEVFGRGVKLKREDLEDLFDSMPESAKKQLMNSGNPGTGKKKWYGQDKDGNDTVVTSGTRSRGLAVLDMYLRQGGTDAYQFGGRIFSPADFDVEHVKPVSTGGADHPRNWVLARSGAQRLRADEHLGKWIDSLPDPNDKVAMANYVDVRRKTDSAKRAIKALSREAYDRRKEYTDEEWYAIPNKKRMQITKLESGKEKLPRREPIGEYMFITGGKKDGFLAGAALHDPRKGGDAGADESTRGGRIAAPDGWKSAYAMYRKDHSAEESFKFREQINDVWKTFAKDRTASYDEMASDMKFLFKNNLTSNQFRLVQNDIDKGNANFKSSWGSKGGKPAAVTQIAGVNVSGLKPAQIGVLTKMENAGMSSADIREIIEGMKSGD